MPNVNTNEVESNEAKRIDDHDDNQHENGVSNDFNVNVRLPNGQKVTIKSVNTIEAYSLITQSLKEFIETAHLTSFHLEIASNDDDHEVIIINELVDFNQYAIPTESDNHDEILVVHLNMVFDYYDIKSVRNHIARTREVIMHPPCISGIIDDKLIKTMPNSDGIKSNFTLPDKKRILERIKLNEFFEHTLFVSNNIESPVEVKQKKLSDCIRSIAYSGWNPPPPSRRMQGDLAYLEVLTEEGPIHITAVQRGFFVNKTTRQIFNPSPAANNCFSHNLLETLSTFSPSCFKVFNSIQENIVEKMKSNDGEFSGVLAPITQLFLEGRGHLAINEPLWASFNNSKNTNDHTFDLYRSQEDLCNSFGVDEKGTSKEWNEEFQSILHLSHKSQLEEILKYRYLYRITHEFSESCKTIVVAISEGHITPINPAESHSTHAYFYNNIFFSRSIETKESFKLCQGDEANRKAAGHDHNNQKIIQSFSIDGLNVTLQCIVDYKGERFQAQTVIPGILQSSEPNARLMMGSVDYGKRFNSKTDAFELMKTLCSHFHIKPRNIEPIPISNESNQIAPENSDSEMIPSPICIDYEGENAPLDAISIPHVGPLEGKILKGADNRLYLLEMIRFTPRDANYVKDTRCTGNIAKEYLEAISDNIAMVYVIRTELINAYINSKIAIARYDIIQEYMVAESENKTAAESDESSKNEIALEMTSKMEAITIDSLNLDINPNVFFNFSSDVDPDVSLKDEALARDLADYLWSTQIPLFTKRILGGELVIYDNAMAINFLHENGINVRYIGQLARLALEQEEEDIKLLNNNKHRIQSMPLYWLEMLEIEMIARALKHLLRNKLTDPLIQSAPSDTIASMLNHCLGTSSGQISNESYKKIESQKVISNELEKKSAKKKKSKNMSKGRLSTILPDPKNGAVSRDDLLDEINTEVMTRFSYTLTLVNGKDSKSFLKERISPLTLLRRICQVLNLKIALRDYNFESSTPFEPSDIIDLLPKLKGCEPSIPYPSANEMFAQAIQFLKDGNLPAAEAYIHEATHTLQTVTGGLVHKDIITYYTYLSRIYEYSEDMNTAIDFAAKALLLSVQGTGLDSNETYTHHLKLGVMFSEVNNNEYAIKHLLSAKYLLELIGGKNHPELYTIYLRLANIYLSYEEYNTALEFLNEASLKLTDYRKSSIIHSTNALIHSELGEYELAVSHSKQNLILIQQLYGENDEKYLEAKALNDKYRRASIEFKVKLSKEEQLQNQTREEEKLVAKFQNLNNNNKNSNNNGKKGKNRK